MIAHNEYMRTILHSDLNNFYASVECLKNPQIRNRPVVVTGSREDRHGVVLAKNELAKSMGVKTGDVFWEAKQKCGSGLAEAEADFSTYIAVSNAVRKIYSDYTDVIEAYGIDECWLDVTDSLKIFGSGVKIAEDIRARIRREIGLTVSVGVSWNKIFAKLGSDMKKPDAVTEITLENFKDKVWVLPVEELLYVGSSTKRKLNGAGIKTIGDLANTPVEKLCRILGKWGIYLHQFANGTENSPVVNAGQEESIKSIGNSLTLYRDLENTEEVEPVIRLLADSVCSRMREVGLSRARTVRVCARGSDLSDFSKQCKAPRPTGNVGDIASVALKLFNAVYPWGNPVRSLGISVSDFCFGDIQLDMFGDIVKDEKQQKLYSAIDKIRKKYGNKIIQSAIIYKDKKLSDLDIKSDHTIHPYSFFKK